MRIDSEVDGQPVRVFHLPEPTDRALARFKRFVRSDDVFGYDVETTAIDEEAGGVFDPNLRMRLIQFGSVDEAWCLDPHVPFWRHAVESLLRHEGKRFVTHTNYDTLWARKEFGIDLGERSIDTLPMLSLLTPGVMTPKDLKAAATNYIDAQLEEAADALIARFKELAPVGHRVGPKLKAWGFTNIPLDDPIFALYGGLDAIYVRRLLDIVSAELRRTKMAKLSKREQRVQRQANRLQERGMRVDGEWAGKVLDEVEREYMAADERLRDVFGFTPRSPRVPQWLEDHGVEFNVFTKTGNGELSKDTLPDLVAKYEEDPVLGPVLADKWTLSRNQNVLTNLRTIVNAADRDGRVHPKIKTMKAHTGRESITGPAMQTFKKDDKRLRGCFLADEGHVLVGADYDSQEIRIAAALSRDKNLLKIVREGLNQHVLTAQSIFKNEFISKEESPGPYKKAKVLDFAQQFGAGPAKIAWQLGIPLEEAKKLWNAWRATYSGLVLWTDRVGELSVVVNPWGRRIPRDPYRPYANGNYLIQSSGRDMLGDALVELQDCGWGDTLWLPIHDEIVLQVPEDRAEEAKAVLAKAMFCEFGDIDVPASPEIIGTRWSGGS